MRTLILTAVLVFATTGAGASDPEDVTLKDGRRYVALIPDGVTAPPLVVALHGGGGSPEQFMRDSDLGRMAAAAGVAIVFPAGTSRRGAGLLVWNAGYCCGYATAAGIDDIGFLDRLIADATRRFGLDSQRVFIAGMSNGGIMAETYAAVRPGRIRAAASVAGPMDIGRGRPRGPVPLLHIHGTADDHVPYLGGRGQKSFVRTEFAAVEEVIAAFRRAAPKPLRPVRDVIDRAADGMQVERTRWIGPDGRDQVVLMKIVGGGHHWPGGRRSARRGATRDINAGAEILRFFAGHL